MPGRKSTGRNGPIHRRARTGCRSCRARKIKCDEAKPACKNCSSRGIPCDSGLQLKWLEEFQTRGAAFGREGIWTKDSARGQPPRSPTRAVAVPGRFLSLPPFGPQHFLHTKSSDFEESDGPAQCDVVPEEEDDDVARVGDSPEMRVAKAWLWPVGLRVMASSPSPAGHMRGVDSSLLEYYLRRLCPLTTSSHSCPSPFADLILPLFATPGHEDVLRSLMAFSARHRSKSDPRWSHAAMSLKGGVLASLQKRLAVPDRAMLDTLLPQVLVQMMFLCLYEIVDECDHRWVIHLRASQDLIRRSRAPAPTRSRRQAGGLAAFAERFFAFQDAISRTACGNAPLHGIEYWDSLPDKNEVDSWMGCSPELAGILCDITELGRIKRAGSIPATEFFERADVLERRIHSLASTTKAEDDADLVSSAELKRQSALLYINCVLYDGSPSTPIVSQLVRDVLGGIHRLLRSGCAKTLAFPVFVAAVELDPTDEAMVYDPASSERIHGRRLVLSALDAMATDSLSNVTRTRAVIKKVWRLRDMHIEDQHAAKKTVETRPTRENDWSTIVGPNSAHVSLA